MTASDLTPATPPPTAPSRRGPRKRDAQLSPIPRVSIVDALVEQMTRNILEGTWQPGEVLPSLREFAAECDVSMLTVREAIRILQARGWVETRHGIGTFVQDPPPDEGFVPWKLGASDVDEYLELVEARGVIEAAIIDFAASRRTRAELERLEDVLAKMEAARTDSEKFAEADTEFHLAVAEAAHNRVLLRSFMAIRSPMRRLALNRQVEDLQRLGSFDHSIEGHRQIMDGIRRGDADAAKSILSEILKRGEAHLGDLSSGR